MEGAGLSRRLFFAQIGQEAVNAVLGDLIQRRGCPWKMVLAPLRGKLAHYADQAPVAVGEELSFAALILAVRNPGPLLEFFVVRQFRCLRHIPVIEAAANPPPTFTLFTFLYAFYVLSPVITRKLRAAH